MNSLGDLVRRHQATGAKLSSNQDFHVLDQLLVRALEPMEAETDVFWEWLAEVAAFTVTSRRKTNEPLIAVCIAGLCGAKNSASAVITSGIDRGHVLNMLSRAAPLGVSLEAAQVEYLRCHGNRVASESLVDLRRIKAILGNKPSVTPAMRTARYWYNLALRHKESIISHYMRLLLKVSTRVSHGSGNRIETEPVFADAYITAGEAVNQFRADKGVFAGYLGFFLKGSARSSAQHALGLAAPGARVASADALQADGIEGALEIGDQTIGVADESIVPRLDFIAADPDVRAALMVSDVVPPEIARMRTEIARSKQSMQTRSPHERVF